MQVLEHMEQVLLLMSMLPTTASNEATYLNTLHFVMMRQAMAYCCARDLRCRPCPMDSSPPPPASIFWPASTVQPCPPPLALSLNNLPCEHIITAHYQSPTIITHYHHPLSSQRHRPAIAHCHRPLPLPTINHHKGGRD